MQGVAYFALIFGGVGLMFYGEGVRALMELPSIISHILSYTRIVGILLASVILAHVIDFIFLKSLDNSIAFSILGIMIFLIGHTFNIIIGVFEPGIQGARLIYVEFFSKFYHGAGRAFKPFGSKLRATSGFVRAPWPPGPRQPAHPRSPLQRSISPPLPATMSATPLANVARMKILTSLLPARSNPEVTA